MGGPPDRALYLHTVADRYSRLLRAKARAGRSTPDGVSATIGPGAGGEVAMGATMGAPAYLRQVNEAQWQALVVDLAKTLGWLPVHFRQMVGNPAGFPDLLLFRDGRVVVAEIKRDGGRLGPRQREWIDRFAEYGVTVHVWYPSSWATVEAVLRADGGGAACYTASEEVNRSGG